MKTFQQILRDFRVGSASEREKGGKFERLMRGYLLTSPTYATTMKTVWLWNEFPFRSQFGGSDLGIDLVAQTYENEFWAIQCKCYLEDTTIDKAEVDSFISTSGKSFYTDSRQVSFAHRLWISTTNKWGSNAEETIRNQSPAINRVSLYDLENEAVDWEKILEGAFGSGSRQKPFEVREHQQKALDKAKEYFKSHDRGKMIMACGTGKTFTSLKLAEQETDGHGLVLFLVPSIALLGQMLREWSAQSVKPIYPICICSDRGVSKKTTQNDDESYSTVDLALPASTSVDEIVRRLRFAQENNKDGMTVVFSTYQSIDVISAAQERLLSGDGLGIFNAEGSEGYGVFDLVICDEAHRTTGVTLKGSEDSNFVKVHYNEFIRAKKRVYMTATPRLYSEDAKSKADRAEAVLCSMDDINLYGEEFYRIGFGEAVDKNLLSDYKVLILTINEDNISPTLRKYLTNENGEVNADDGGKIVGCINALSKKIIGDAQDILKTDAEPMHKAVAFCSNIKVSKATTELFNNCKDKYLEDLTEEERAGIVNVKAKHIDGAMSAPTRDEKLAWLKAASEEDNECRILTNVRCLSEGVDVPSLDAVLFLSPRNSQVDVVQSVGRVMRTAKGKKYGYIIIPVVVPPEMDANEAMDNSDRFKVVWTVLNALRAHDDRFEATVNKIELNKNKPKQVLIGGIGGGTGENGWEYSNQNAGIDVSETAKQLELQFEELSSTFYAKMVQKVGDKRYWEQWAGDVAKIAEAHIARINKLIAEEGKPKREFERFMKGLRKNINPSITEADAIEMISQHIITKPVFEALFDNFSFVNSNPISKSMQKVLELIEEHTPEEDNAKLDAFYDSVRRRAKGIDNAEAKQKVIVELYDKFFKAAFPKVVEKLGIVYTPVEVVDYIIKSVAWILKKEFDRDISDENIHILDAFTGTGTFITRLLQSGVISKEALARKYDKEIHANEIVLLAYYIASINIENVFHDIQGEEEEYKPFNGICLTDTFQLGEETNAENIFSEVFPHNSKRVQEQKKKPITIIIGNPPYSAKQKNANDDAQNQFYPTLERRIADTYALKSTATNKTSLYDSYIKAFRWATDRISDKDGGVIGFITNSGWLDGNSFDGFRKTLEHEFSSIYVFNLRGAIRGKSREAAKREGQNVFDIMTGVAIVLLVKSPSVLEQKQKAIIHYACIEDYLSREQKKQRIKQLDSISSPLLEWKVITPNDDGDWISQRNEAFSSFIPIGDKDNKNNRNVFFVPKYSRGVATAKDGWAYNSSLQTTKESAESQINYYNNQVRLLKSGQISEVEMQTTKISWSRSVLNDVMKHKEYCLSDVQYREAMYRPFFKQNMVYYRPLIDMIYQIPYLFPTTNHTNIVICVSGLSTKKDYSVFLTNATPDLNILEAGTQCFPLYWYDESTADIADLFNQAAEEEVMDRYIKRDGISDWILRECKQRYGNKVTKEDIFYYVYGILHSPEYRTTFEADLKKMLPRLPLVDSPDTFIAFSQAGRKLADLHLNYETVEPYKGVTVKAPENANYEVLKMRFGKIDSKTADKSKIIYNSQITIEDIPSEAYDYVVNGKSALEWIMERYQVTTDGKSGIVNNPNDWSKEHGDEKYIFNLVLRIITVSVETMKIVSSLPKLKFE